MCADSIMFAVLAGLARSADFVLGKIMLSSVNQASAEINAFGAFFMGVGKISK